MIAPNRKVSNSRRNLFCRACLIASTLLVGLAVPMVAGPPLRDESNGLNDSRRSPRNIGTIQYDISYDVASDSHGNAFITGGTAGKLGSAKKGYGDAWVAKYSARGKQLWKRQIGSSSSEAANSAATDRNGNVYISGWTNGNLAGSSAGDTDAWVAKYSAKGRLLWKQQIGSSDYDESFGVTTDRIGSVILTGWTFGNLGGTSGRPSDAWVAKYSTNGKLLWKRQIDTPAHEGADGVATDKNNNIIIAGYTDGRGVKGSAAWVAKFNPNGNQLWRRLLDSSDYESATDITTDSSNNIIVTGETGGNLAGPNRGSDDAWIVKFSPSGSLVWKQQVASKDWDHAEGIATDSEDNVFISGQTAGPLGGKRIGGIDAWVMKYDAGGKLQWKRQFGTHCLDISHGVATDGKGSVFITGETEGRLGVGSLKGGQNDAWLAKLSPFGKVHWFK